MIRRLVTSGVAIAAVVASVWIGSSVSLSSAPQSNEQVVTVTPARQDVVCPGPLVTPAGATGNDPELGGAAQGIARDTFSVGDRRRIGEGVASDGVVAAAVERISGGDISGLAAITCTAPQTDQWLVGGNTVVGDSSRLVLSNPSLAAVEVTVTPFGSIGPVEGERVVPIGPQSQAELLLEGAAVNVSGLVVHVQSTGNGVVAALQHSRLDGFQPAGTDWVVAGAGPAADLVIPGVGVADPETTSAVVRLMAPEGATATLALATPDGDAVWEGVAALALEPGVAIEVPVPAVADGAVTISADAPVVAGSLVTRVRQSTIGVEGATAQEIRWLPAQLPGEESERAVLAVGYTQTLSVYASSSGAFTLIDDAGRTVVSQGMSAGTTFSIRVSVPSGTMLTAQGPFAWNVLVDDAGFLSALAPTRITIDDVDVAVLQERYIPEP